MNDYGVSEFDDPHGAAFAVTVRSFVSDMPEDDRLGHLLRRLMAEGQRFAAPRAAAPRATASDPALRLLAYDGLLTEILGEELCAGRLAAAGLETLGRLVEDESRALKEASS